jgi:hypothetical protein
LFLGLAACQNVLYRKTFTVSRVARLGGRVSVEEEKGTVRRTKDMEADGLKEAGEQSEGMTWMNLSDTTVAKMEDIPSTEVISGMNFIGDEDKGVAKEEASTEMSEDKNHLFQGGSKELDSEIKVVNLFPLKPKIVR